MQPSVSRGGVTAMSSRWAKTMLSEVITLLADNAWFDPSQAYDKTVHLTHGAAQSMLLGRGGSLSASSSSASGAASQSRPHAARKPPGAFPAWCQASWAMQSAGRSRFL